MTIRNVWYHTSDGSQLATADISGTLAETLVVLSETDADGLTKGQLAFKHNISQGTEPGHWGDSKL